MTEPTGSAQKMEVAETKGRVARATEPIGSVGGPHIPSHRQRSHARVENGSAKRHFWPQVRCCQDRAHRAGGGISALPSSAAQPDHTRHISEVEA